jgi:tetratricopeptide (TPR) repeat protein
LLFDQLTSDAPTAELSIALRILRASSYCSGGRYRQSNELLEQAIRDAADCGLTALEAEANVRRGFLFYQLNRFTESEQCYQRALDLGSGLADKYLQAIAMAGIGKNIMRSGRYVEATEYFRELRNTANEIGELLFSAVLACEVGWGHMNQRDFVPALNALLEAEPVLKKAGLKQMHGICEADIGYIYLQWGSYPVAVSYFQRALATATEIGDVVSQRKWSQNLAIAYSKLGDEEMSRRYVQDTLRREAALAAERAEVG